MPTKKTASGPTATPTLPTMVMPGERAVLLSHHEYLIARSAGQGLENYDLLMREPDDEEPTLDGDGKSPQWMAIRADKYLKHRANGWREAESLDELPSKWRDRAADRFVFPPTSDTDPTDAVAPESTNGDE